MNGNISSQAAPLNWCWFDIFSCVPVCVGKVAFHSCVAFLSLRTPSLPLSFLLTKKKKTKHYVLLSYWWCCPTSFALTKKERGKGTHQACHTVCADLRDDKRGRASESFPLCSTLLSLPSVFLSSSFTLLARSQFLLQDTSQTTLQKTHTHTVNPQSTYTKTYVRQRFLRLNWRPFDGQ